MNLCQIPRGCGFFWSHNLQFCCRDVDWLCQHRIALLLAWAALIIHSTYRGVKGLSHCAKVTVYPGKILKDYSFTTLCTWKGKKPHKLSLEDYLLFCTCWTLYGLWQGSWGRGGILVLFRWMEINCLVTEPLFLMMVNNVQQNKWICLCLSIDEVGNWMDSDLGSAFSFTENWWHDLEQLCFLALLISPLPIVLLIA